VYATEPSVLLGRIFMEEMAEFLDRSPKPRKSARWKTVLRHLPPPLGDLKVGVAGIFHGYHFLRVLSSVAERIREPVLFLPPGSGINFLCDY
jgi:hypothetical protein